MHEPVVALRLPPANLLNRFAVNQKKQHADRQTLQFALWRTRELYLSMNRKKEFAYEEVLDEIRATHRLILKQDREPTLEEASVAIEFLKWTELCFETETHQFIFPRGFTSRPPDFIEQLQVVTLRWDFLPEAAFHRFVVRLLNLKLISERDDGWAIDRFSAGFNIQSATGFVRANPEKGVVEIRYLGDDKSAWEPFFYVVVEGMSGLLGNRPDIEPGRKPREVPVSSESLRPRQDDELRAMDDEQEPTPFDDAPEHANYVSGSTEATQHQRSQLHPLDRASVDAICRYLADDMDFKLNSDERYLLRRLFSESRTRIHKKRPRFYLRVLVFRELLLVLNDYSEKLKKSDVTQWDQLIELLSPDVPSNQAAEDGKQTSMAARFLESNVIRWFQVNELFDKGGTRITGGGLRKNCTGVFHEHKKLIEELRLLMRHPPKVWYGNPKRKASKPGSSDE